MVGEVPAEFDALVERLNDELPDRLQEEPDADRAHRASSASRRSSPRCKAARLRFPQPHLRADPLSGQRHSARLLLHLRHPGRHADRPGARRDRAAASARRRRTATLSGRGKSFFLHDLLNKVIFAEAGWVSLDRAAVRRAADPALRRDRRDRPRLGGPARRLGLELRQQQGADRRDRQPQSSDYRVAAGDELSRTGDFRRRRDLGNARRRSPRTSQLRTMPAGYAHARRADAARRELSASSQRGRCSSRRPRPSYRKALERMFRSRLILRLEQQIEAA